MGDSTTTASGILKDYYEGPIGKLINEEHPFASRIKPLTKGWVGNQLKYGIVTARNHGSRGISPTGKVPVAGNVGTANTTITAKVIAGRAQIDVALINAAKTDKGAFIEGIDLTMTGLKESCQNSFNRQLIGRSYSASSVYTTGLLAKVTTGVSSATQTFDTNQYFEVGRSYYIGTTTQIAAVSGGVSGTVLSISDDGVTVVFTASITTVTNDYVAQYDANGVGYTFEFSGTEHMVNNANDNFLGVDTGVNPAWASTVKGNSGVSRALTFRLLDMTNDSIKVASGAQPDLMLVDESFVREYHELIRADIRYNPGQMAGGDINTSYTHFGKKVEMVVDRLAPRGKATFLNTSALNLALRQPWKFMEDDGAILSRVPEYRAYEMVYSTEGELATNSRNKHGKLTDISYSLTA